jgi:hypothetical protein
MKTPKSSRDGAKTKKREKILKKERKRKKKKSSKSLVRDCCGTCRSDSPVRTS